jgi:hypothetical protein
MNPIVRAMTTVALAAGASLGGAPATAQETPPAQPGAPQTTPPSPPPAGAQQPPAPAAPESELSKWGFDLSAYVVNPPEHDPYTSTTLKADRDWLHLEARWNYEALHTGSLFVGGNLEWKNEVELSVTPMVGVVAGEVDGVAPGVELDATWKWLEFYDESEYVVSTNDHNDNFIYSWAELTVAPVDWLKTGLVAQRTRAYDTRLSVDRGLLLSLSHKNVTGTIYWFNPDKSGSYVMFTIAFSM